MSLLYVRIPMDASDPQYANSFKMPLREYRQLDLTTKSEYKRRRYFADQHAAELWRLHVQTWYN